MRLIPRNILSLLCMTGTAFMLMGAAGQINSGVTGGVNDGMMNAQRQGVHSATTASIISKQTVSPVTLSPYAEGLARSIGFDRHILLVVKEETQDRIGRLIGYDENGYQIIASGIAVSVPEEKTDQILESLRRKLGRLGYMPFVVEMNDGINIDRIGVLKTADQFEILRVMHTDGDAYDIANQDVIERLKEWEESAHFDIIGADYDWVELEFASLPSDLKAFAEEVYDFCPDAVDQGPGTVEELVKDLRSTKRLFLWWD